MNQGVGSTASTRIVLVTPMFDHGGVISYWRDVMNQSTQNEWLVFTNTAADADQDPFKRSNVRLTRGLEWTSVLRSSQNLMAAVEAFAPRSVAFNGTLTLIRVLPAIIYFRLFRRDVLLRCVFHNGAIYASAWKNIVNRLVVSFCGLWMHDNVFVSRFVGTYWLCPGREVRRPFAATPRQKQPACAASSTPPMPVIGFLGRLSHEKDPGLFLQAMDILRSKLPCRVVVAGTGPLQAELAATYAWAEFPGWVAPAAWLRQVDLMVTTSRTEGWPYAVGEAIESGVPVVGLDVGGVSEMLGPGRQRWLCVDRDPAVVAALAERFLRNYRAEYDDYFLPDPDAAVGRSLTAQAWAEMLVAGMPQDHKGAPDGS